MKVFLKQPKIDTGWYIWYAWFPVYCYDIHAVVWLEHVWYRRHVTAAYTEARGYRAHLD